MTTWFTADLHLGHKNILEFEKEHRPFSTVEEMNETLVERWNSVVQPKDKVYVLGDVAFGKDNLKYLAMMKGTKILVMGNHDMHPTAEYLKYFSRCQGVLYWKLAILTHVPIHMYNYSAHFKGYGLTNRMFLNVHGHLHSKRIMIQPPPCRGFVDDLNYLCVSVEQNNLTPIHEDVIKNRMIEIAG